jgi:hypothetical protein
MKKIFINLSFIIISTISYTQETNPAKSLVANNDFINWINSLTNNEWEIYLDFKNQLGNRLAEFKNTLLTATNNEDVNKVISKFGLNAEFSDQKMAEHLVFGLYFKQENPWLWSLSESERLKIIHDAFFAGMSSIDPRWAAIQQNLRRKVETHCGTTFRMIDDIISCFWDTIKEGVGIVTGFTALTSAINNGNWSATISAIKKILKTAGRRLGWFGLAIAAVDIGICIWNSVD